MIRLEEKASGGVRTRLAQDERGSVMPKMKTKKSLVRRFKITGTGKVLRSQCGKSHRMVSFTGKRVRQLRNKKLVKNALAKRIKRGLLAS